MKHSQLPPNSQNSLREAKNDLAELRDLSKAGMFTQSRFVSTCQRILDNLKAFERQPRIVQLQRKGAA